jgi:hypothetical protein
MPKQVYEFIEEKIGKTPDAIWRFIIIPFSHNN